jgi:hypothetical protein
LYLICARLLLQRCHEEQLTRQPPPTAERLVQ